MVRAKFNLHQVKQISYQHGGSLSEGDEQKTIKSGRILVFGAVYDDGTPENQRFSKSTPSGTIEMQVDNPSALEWFEIGKSYYVDFVPTQAPQLKE